MNLGRYVVRKLVEIVPALVVISFLVFALVHLTPGDPITRMLGSFAAQDVVDATRAQYQLDKPLSSQYFSWVGRVIRGDLGRSIQAREPVAEMIADRLPVTDGNCGGCAIGEVLSLREGVLRGRMRDPASDHEDRSG